MKLINSVTYLIIQEILSNFEHYGVLIKQERLKEYFLSYIGVVNVDYAGAII